MLRLPRFLPGVLAGLATLWLLAVAAPSLAGQAWLEVGDASLREDLLLLDDAGVIDLPLAAWPIPVADIERVLEQVESAKLASPAYAAAAARIRRTIRPEAMGRLHTDFLRVSGGRAALLRDFDTAAREDGELTAGLAALGNRWAMELRTTFALSPEDDHSTRLDSSHLTGRFGNWLVSANTLERWWGPGHVSSLILSNNARPIPALTIDRATSSAFRSRYLHWLGPWRFTALLGRMESGRGDFDNPLFLGMRASAAPFKVFEIGLSRSAQFCGEGRPCNFETFKDVLGFNDTAGVTVSPESEPGNQLAGYDARVASPWKSVPVALYLQDIGEDRIEYRPTDRLFQFGLEGWHALANGDVLRGYMEYSDSTCAARSDTPVFNCAYNSGVFFADGYRYYDRAIGHTTDGDSQLRALGLRWTRAKGDAWSLKLRDGALNRDPTPDPNNSVGSGPSDYQSGELAWQGERFGGVLQIQLGYERREPSGASASDDVFGFVSWRTRL